MPSCLLDSLQMRLTAAINLIQHHMDFCALLCVRWAIHQLRRQRRRAVAEVWPRYCCCLTTVMASQYLLCLGPSSALCRGLCSAIFRFGKLRTQKRPKKELGKAWQRRAGGLSLLQLCKRRAPTRRSTSRRGPQAAVPRAVRAAGGCSSGAAVGW